MTLPETKTEETVPAETVETPVETVVETPAVEQTSEAAPVTSDTSDIVKCVYIMLFGAVAVTTAVIKKNKRA